MNDTVIGVVIFSGVLGLIGIIFCIIGIEILINRKSKKMNCTSKVYGKVIKIIRKQHYSIRTRTYIDNWYPVFEYSIGELKFIQTSTYGTLLPSYEKIGQEVELYFNPQNFNEYYVKEETKPEISAKQ